MMTTNKIYIVECVRCQEPQVFDNSSMKYIPEALEVNLNGGYGMFVDNWQDRDDYKLMLCHECAHKLVLWLGIPQVGTHGHPRTKDSFCTGWTLTEDDFTLPW